MIVEIAYELLCCHLGLVNKEKAGLCRQVNELIAKLKTIEVSNKENSMATVNTVNDLKNALEKQLTAFKHYQKYIEFMRK